MTIKIIMGYSMLFLQRKDLQLAQNTFERIENRATLNKCEISLLINKHFDL